MPRVSSFRPWSPTWLDAITESMMQRPTKERLDRLLVERAALGISGLVLIVVGMLAFMALVLAVPALYDKWLAFAVWLSVWATRAIFSIIYFAVVPFTWLFYLISRRSRSGGQTGDSLWIPMRKHARSIDELQRMA